MADRPRHPLPADAGAAIARSAEEDPAPPVSGDPRRAAAWHNQRRPSIRAPRSPGISRLIKQPEATRGIRLFKRRAGPFVPSVKAGAVFDHIRCTGIDDLQQALPVLRKAEEMRLTFARLPSIARFIAARAIRDVRQSYPDPRILKTEDTIHDCCWNGEFVFMSSARGQPGIYSTQFGAGPVVTILAKGNPLADREETSIHDMIGEGLIGVDPSDSCGAQLARPFPDARLTPSHDLRGRLRRRWSALSGTAQRLR